MICPRLDRYLEAYLDGDLRRGQAILLRRHLQSCASCRARVAKLEAFEREVRERVPAMARQEPIWSRLEQALVAPEAGGGSAANLASGAAAERRRARERGGDAADKASDKSDDATAQSKEAGGADRPQRRKADRAGGGDDDQACARAMRTRRNRDAAGDERTTASGASTSAGAPITPAIGGAVVGGGEARRGLEEARANAQRRRARRTLWAASGLIAFAAGAAALEPWRALDPVASRPTLADPRMVGDWLAGDALQGPMVPATAGDLVLLGGERLEAGGAERAAFHYRAIDGSAARDAVLYVRARSGERQVDGEGEWRSGEWLYQVEGDLSAAEMLALVKGTL